jgi:hypothetical protein
MAVPVRDAGRFSQSPNAAATPVVQPDRRRDAGADESARSTGFGLHGISRWVARRISVLLCLSSTPTPYASWPVWAACIASTVFAALVAVSTGVDIAWGGFVGPVAVTLGLVAIYWAIRWRSTTPELESAPGALAAICWSGLMGLIATHAGLRADNPLIDEALARSDSLLGFSAPWLIGAVSGHARVTGFLNFVYHSALLAVWVTAVALSFGKYRQRSWDLAFSFAFGATVCGAIAVLYPAEGTFAYYHIASDVVAGLPRGAGTFYMPVFDALRAGTTKTIDFAQMTGVVTFPSFHGAMAVMTAFALRDVRWLAPFAWIWCVIVNISAVPMGGHYGIDLVVGDLLWAFSAWIMSIAVRRAGRSDLARSLPASPGRTIGSQIRRADSQEGT